MVVSRNSTNIKEVKQHSIITPQIQLFFLFASSRNSGGGGGGTAQMIICSNFACPACRPGLAAG